MGVTLCANWPIHGGMGAYRLLSHGWQVLLGCDRCQVVGLDTLREAGQCSEGTPCTTPNWSVGKPPRAVVQKVCSVPWD